jgi:REP element-mobilizing transposase RayT
MAIVLIKTNLEVHPMPRPLRVKSYDSIYHVMVKSIKEVQLFSNEDDKKNYLGIMKYYQEIYQFRVYAYCLMSNHAHFIIDANGSDISSVMHDINFKYACEYNAIHDREGHLFQDRFKSKVVDSEKYLYVLSAYVHNNATDIEGYEKNPQDYEFSSLMVYLGKKSDPYELVEDSFILGMLGEKEEVARKNYLKLVNMCGELKTDMDIEFEEEKTEYRSGRKLLVRNFKPDDVVKYIAGKFDMPVLLLQTKFNRDLVKAKALVIYIMKSLCNMKCTQICEVLGALTQTRISKLTNIAVELIRKEERYREMVQGFIECYSAQEI